jgi:hypothetical protein
VSINRGASWTRLNSNLPTVAVHEVAQHPTAGELVAATHGRSLWVLDVTPLREMTPAALAAKTALYTPNAAVRWHNELAKGSVYGNGSRYFVGQNPWPGALIYYSLNHKAEKASLKVVDFTGKTLQEKAVGTGPGLHRVLWNVAGLHIIGAGKDAAAVPQPILIAPLPLSAKPGMYQVVLTVDGETFSRPLRIEADPTQPPVVVTPDARE